MATGSLTSEKSHSDSANNSKGLESESLRQQVSAGFVIYGAIPLSICSSHTVLGLGGMSTGLRH